MKGKPRIGIDIDGCIAYILDAIRLEAKYRFDINFDLCDIKVFNLKSQGMTRKQIVNIIEDWEVLRSLPTIYYAYEALNKLYEDFEVHLVSARNEVVEQPTKEWLYYNHLPYDYLMVGHDCKYDYAKKTALLIFVEDRYRNALKLAEYCNIIYLVNKTYNLGRPVPENIVRVEGWHDILEHLYANKR